MSALLLSRQVPLVPPARSLGPAGGLAPSGLRTSPLPFAAFLSILLVEESVLPPVPTDLRIRVLGVLPVLRRRLRLTEPSAPFLLVRLSERLCRTDVGVRAGLAVTGLAAVLEALSRLALPTALRLGLVRAGPLASALGPVLTLGRLLSRRPLLARLLSARLLLPARSLLRSPGVGL